MGEIGKAVTSGIMALIGSMGGAYFVAATQADLWRKEATFKFTTDYFNRRIEIYRSITGLMAEAQRLKILHGAKGAKGASIIERTLYCVNTPAHAAVESCQFDLADKDGIAVARDVLDLHGKFESFRVAAGVYFCNSTRDALRSLPTAGESRLI